MRRPDRPAAPQCRVTIVQTASRKVLGRHAGELKRPNLTLLPPVAFDNAAGPVPTQEVRDAKRREPRNRRITSYQPPDSRDIEVIVVVVGQYDSVDRRQRIEVYRRRYTSPGTRETER